MNICPINFFSTKNYNNNYTPNFTGRGKPLTLDYIVKNRANLLPKRILIETIKILEEKIISQPSLMEIHKKIYTPLRECNSLDEVKSLYPEFSEMKDKVIFQRDGKRKIEFEQKTGNDFPLKMLKLYWCDLKTLDEIAKEMNFKNRTSLDWALNQINFPRFVPNYKTVLNASDEEGNKLIASKTTAWNTLHPDLMYAKNKHAAQGCKTEEYREAQSLRMKKYHEEHPKLKEKISEFDKMTWDMLPDLRDAISETMRQYHLEHVEYIRGGFGLFWDTYPEYKKLYSEAKQELKKTFEPYKE